jgi:hypothetical protein
LAVPTTKPLVDRRLFTKVLSAFTDRSLHC